MARAKRTDRAEARRRYRAATAEESTEDALGPDWRDQLVETTWQESESGPPRRYYQLTDSGRRALADFSDEWARFRDSVDALLQHKEKGHEREH